MLEMLTATNFAQGCGDGVIFASNACCTCLSSYETYVVSWTHFSEHEENYD